MSWDEVPGVLCNGKQCLRGGSKEYAAEEPLVLQCEVTKLLGQGTADVSEHFF